MDISKLPLNQKTTIVAQKFIIAIAERISNDEVIISYINLEKHEEVLRLLQRIETGAQLLRHLEPSYWNIYADGKYIADFDFSVFNDLEVKIKVNTLDKSLEILSFNNKVKKNRKGSGKMFSTSSS